MLRDTLLSASALALAAVSSPALAGGGVFDALDPCIGAGDAFRAERTAVIQNDDQALARIPTMTPTPEYRKAWMATKKKNLRKTFDETVAPALTDAGVTDLDKAYEGWFAKQIDRLNVEQLEQLITAHFREDLKELGLKQRAKNNADLQAQQADIDKSCKMDVGNQALRGALTVALAPVEMVSRNLEIAKRESGEIAKGLAATTGISVRAIEENGGVLGGGLSGGPNSFFRKNLGIRF
jgi:hypothetical protein